MNRYGRIVKTDINGKVPCNNDSTVIVTKTNIPLTVTNTSHSYAFLTIVNKDVTLLQQPDLINITALCADSQIVAISAPNLLVNSGAICKGDSIVLSASGGTSYSWSPATGLN